MYITLSFDNIFDRSATNSIKSKKIKRFGHAHLCLFIVRKGNGHR